jgi:hypothetical protein
VILSAEAAEAALTEVKNSFANFGEWDFNNEVNGDYDGFACWGSAFPPDDDDPCFFVTFNLTSEGWTGFLTVGQWAYYWSNTNEGDSFLLETDRVPTLAEAIRTLKGRIRSLADRLTA